jgi:hypothetical protein
VIARIGRDFWLEIGKENTVSSIAKTAMWRLRKHTEVVATTTHVRIKSLCFPNNKWAQNNPGITLAICLSHIFNVSFTDAVTELKAERFHVYGPVRLIQNKIDDWYRDAKGLVYPAFNSSLSVLSGAGIVSFHYVEAAEAQMLYKLLEVDKIQDYHSAEDIFKAWPSTFDALGGYSYKLQSIEEADKLRKLLGEIRS